MVMDKNKQINITKVTKFQQLQPELAFLDPYIKHIFRMHQHQTRLTNTNLCQIKWPSLMRE